MDMLASQLASDVTAYIIQRSGADVPCPLFPTGLPCAGHWPVRINPLGNELERSGWGRPLHAHNNATVETRWCQLRNVIQCTALEVLGRARRQHQAWFDDNDADISNLLVEKNGLHKTYMDLRTDATKAALFRCHHLVKHRLREMPNARVVQKAEEIQGYVERNAMNNFSKAIKAIYVPCI
ncbi:unnamed protein product [Schistocephalus solidus]|uniref:Uncharacterized protein n=1 Tax=Schistocephalus solidus TaxID=70667 RepID=A0A183SIY7_SCHSO|nr:unnamed protein product [Schistocephalus solidus]